MLPSTSRLTLASLLHSGSAPGTRRLSCWNGIPKSPHSLSSWDLCCWPKHPWTWPGQCPSPRHSNQSRHYHTPRIPVPGWLIFLSLLFFIFIFNTPEFCLHRMEKSATWLLCALKNTSPVLKAKRARVTPPPPPEANRKDHGGVMTSRQKSCSLGQWTWPWRQTWPWRCSICAITRL